LRFKIIAFHLFQGIFLNSIDKPIHHVAITQMPSPKKLTLVQYDDSLSQDFTLQKGKKMQKISVQP